MPPAPPPSYQPAYITPEGGWQVPRFHFRVNDVSSIGSIAFFNSVQAPSLLYDAVIHVLKRLYTPASAPKSIRSVTLILRPMEGVAYTTSSDLDKDHKEIHFSTNYIQSIADRAKDEIYGVVIHEMVHCFQYNGLGSCPGGLIEGIADYVRLRAGYAPPHWKRGGTKWDAGYQNTAYFLDWVERKYGSGRDALGFVSRLNESMKESLFDEIIFTKLTGKSVQSLWDEYRKDIPVESSATPLPTENITKPV